MTTCPRRTECCKALRLTSWNAGAVGGRKLEMEHFTNQDCETFLNTCQVFRLPNYVCLGTDILTAGDSTAIMVCRSIVHNSVPVPDLTTWRIQQFKSHCPANRRKPFRLTLRLSAQWSERTQPPVSARKFRAWWLATWTRNTWFGTRGLARDRETPTLICRKNSCLISIPNSPTSNPYNPSAIPISSTSW